MTEYLTPAHVARLTRPTPAAIRLAADAGRLRVAARTAAGGRLFRLADVEAFRDARRRRGTGRGVTPEPN